MHTASGHALAQLYGYRVLVLHTSFLFDFQFLPSCTFLQEEVVPKDSSSSEVSGWDVVGMTEDLYSPVT